MKITRINKQTYSVEMKGETFDILQRSFSDYWCVKSDKLDITHLCDTLSECFDYIEYIMLI